MGIEVEPTRTMDVTEIERLRELATDERGRPAARGVTPQEATETGDQEDGE